MTAECHLCGGPPDHIDGKAYLCADCKARLEDDVAPDEPHIALETPDTDAPGGNSRDENPTLEADKPASTTSDTPDTDGSALVDALEWFHRLSTVRNADTILVLEDGEASSAGPTRNCSPRTASTRRSGECRSARRTSP